jgi:integrase
MAGRSSFGSIRQRSDTHRWQARWQDRAGYSHSKEFRTKREASSWLADQDTERREGSWVDPRHGRETFAALEARWRQTRHGLRPSAEARDVGYIDRYILPTFGGLRLADIEASLIHAWIGDLLERGLAPATVRKAGQLLNQILAAAVADKLIGANPSQGIKWPQPGREEMRFLTPGEVNRLADAIDPRYRGLVLLAAAGGLRIGEITALRQEHLDRERGRVMVAGAITEVEGHLVEGPPKTAAGQRWVPLPPYVIDALPTHDGLVFTAPEGGPIRLAGWRQRFWRPAVTKAGLDPLRIHDLRHTAVSLWIAAGVEPLEIARRAGHTSVSFVLDRYGHLLDRPDDPSIARLEAMMTGASSGGTGR